MVTGIGPFPGLLTFEEDDAGIWTLLGQVRPPPYAPNGAIDVGGLGEGAHSIRVTYAGDRDLLPSTNTFQIDVSKAATQMTVAAPTPVEANHAISVETRLGPEYNNVAGPTGTISVSENGTVLASQEGGRFFTAWLAALPVGIHTFTILYYGDSNYLPVTAQATVTVVPDVVHATVGSLSFSTFYPYKDGYRDSVMARGTRAEPVAVAFAVRNSSGKVVRTGSVARGEGAYSWAWNGRTASGAQVAAGTYTMTTTLRDAAGTTMTVKKSVVVLSKRLYWHSIDLYKTSTQTQKSTSSWGAWLFTMPSGVVYKNLRLYVYGHTNLTFNPSGFAPHDARACPFTSITPRCTLTIYRLSITDNWSSGAVNSTYGRNGRYVRAYVWAGAGGGKVWVKRLRLHVSYALLK